MNKINELKKVNVVVDCDEILFEISPKWSKKIIENEEKLKDYLDINKLKMAYDLGDKFFRNYVLSRDKFHLNKWLGKKSLSEVTSDELNAFLNLYDSKFYDDLEITPLGRSLATMLMTNAINKLYIVSRTTSETLNSKNKALMKYFDSPKVEISYVLPNFKKSDYIKEIDLTDGFIFEDEFENIKDIIDNCNLNRTTIYTPMYGYNDPSLYPDYDLAEKCKQNNCMVVGYDYSYDEKVDI